MADIDIALWWEGRGLELRARGRSGHEVIIDGDTKTGTSPVEALLVSLTACMAADIVDILVKGRVPVTSMEVAASGMRNPEPPRRFLSIRMVFTVGGISDENEPKLERALALSREKYCSVMHTLRPDLEIATELVRTAGTADTNGA